MKGFTILVTLATVLSMSNGALRVLVREKDWQRLQCLLLLSAGLFLGFAGWWTAAAAWFAAHERDPDPLFTQPYFTVLWTLLCGCLIAASYFAIPSAFPGFHADDMGQPVKIPNLTESRKWVTSPRHAFGLGVGISLGTPVAVATPILLAWWVVSRLMCR